METYTAGMAKLTPGQISDRLAILNLLAAMGHFINRGDLDGYMALATEECTYYVELPLRKVRLTKAQLWQAEFPTFEKYRQHDYDSGLTRFMFQTHSHHIIRQGPQIAYAEMSMTVFRIPGNGASIQIESTGYGHGSLVKRGDRWLIHEWTNRMDRSMSRLDD